MFGICEAAKGSKDYMHSLHVFSFHIHFSPCPWILQASAHVVSVSRMWAVGLRFEGQAFPCDAEVWRSCRQSFLCSGKDALLPARCLLKASAAVSDRESHGLAFSHWVILSISGIRVLENASPDMLVGLQGVCSCFRSFYSGLHWVSPKLISEILAGFTAYATMVMCWSGGRVESLVHCD